MNKTILFVGLEILFWLLTALIAFAVVYPIISATDSYPFLVTNIVFVAVLVTCTRYIFLLQHTWLGPLQTVKTALIFVSIWAIFLLTEALNGFQTYLDEEGPAALVGEMNLEKMQGLVGYIRSEMLFFGVGSVLAVIIFAGRMIQSLWNYKNRGVI